MLTAADVHGYALSLERSINRIKKLSSLSNHNKLKILEFQKSCRAQGIGAARVLRYLNDLPKIAGWLNKNFEKATKKDMEKVLNLIEDSHYAPRTKLDFRVTIKKFYKWLNGGEEYPKCVKWIKTGGKRNNNKLPEELLTEEEVKRIIQTAYNPRDRAIIATLWESGARVGELLSMQIKHVSFEENFTRITLQGKTGMRRVPLFDSTPYLAEWLENHPLKEDLNTPLWIGIGNVGRNKRMEYAAMRKMIAQTSRKVGIKKKINPHNFRHSRATTLAKHLTEAQMNQYLGWVAGSDMPATYVHLSGRDVDDAILKMRGLKPKEEPKESTLAPKKCARCGLVNKATGKFCTRCGCVLDLETALTMQETVERMDEKFAKLLEDKGVQKFLLKKLAKLL